MITEEDKKLIEKVKALVGEKNIKVGIVKEVGCALLVIIVLISFIGCNKHNDTSPSTKSSSLESPQAKLVSYEEAFRSNFGKVAHLSLIVYFPPKDGIVNSYGCKYTLIHEKSGLIFHGNQKHYFRIMSCMFGYTGVSEILNSPIGYEFFAEIILKAKQTPDKPGNLSSNCPKPIKEGDWWITKGSDLPSFNATEYVIESVIIYDKKSGETKWQLP